MEFNKTIFSIKQYFIFMANQLIYINKILKKDTLILVY